MPPLKKLTLESSRAKTKNPKIDLQYIGIYSKSDIQRHSSTQQFQLVSDISTTMNIVDTLRILKITFITLEKTIAQKISLPSIYLVFFTLKMNK